MIKIVSLFIAYQLATARKRLLQFPQSYGAFGQLCSPPEPDFACQTSHQAISDQGTGVLQCGTEYSCCLCAYIVCGSSTKPCDAFKAGADFAAFGVQNINILGEVNGNGAIIDCNAEHACAGTYITGSWIDTVRCGADLSCAGAELILSQSKGVVCGQGACVGATMTLNSNRGGELVCGAPTACMSANIEISGIFNIKCNGPQSCENTKIKVNNPLEQFILDCNGDDSCHNLELTINVPGPVGGCPSILNSLPNEPLIWKGINCASNNACPGMKLTVVNNGCKTVLIENLKCSAGNSCSGAIFDLNAGTGFGVEVKNCVCGPSCQFATGLDACYNNVPLLDCPVHTLCATQTLMIHNPANDFALLCSNIQSCYKLQLNIVIAGLSHNLIQRFSNFVCSGFLSCQNMQVNIANMQIAADGTPIALSINSIQCIGRQSCYGATFVTGDNVNIKQIICTDRACDNCLVKGTEHSVGIPCDTYQFIAPIIPQITSTTTTTTTTTTTSPIIYPVPQNTPPVIPNGPVIEIPTTTNAPIAAIPVIPNIVIPTIPDIPNGPVIQIPKFGPSTTTTTTVPIVNYVPRYVPRLMPQIPAIPPNNVNNINEIPPLL